MVHEPDTEPRHRPVDLLEHFVPERVLRELRERALSFQREEQFRAYVLKRAWLLLPLFLVFVIVDTAIAAEMVFLARAAGPSPAPAWFVVAVYCLAAAAWLAGIVAQLHWLFAWLERRALGTSRTTHAPLK